MKKPLPRWRKKSSKPTAGTGGHHRRRRWSPRLQYDRDLLVTNTTASMCQINNAYIFSTLKCGRSTRFRSRTVRCGLHPLARFSGRSRCMFAKVARHGMGPHQPICRVRRGAAGTPELSVFIAAKAALAGMSLSMVQRVGRRQHHRQSTCRARPSLQIERKTVTPRQWRTHHREQNRCFAYGNPRGPRRRRCFCLRRLAFVTGQTSISIMAEAGS